MRPIVLYSRVSTQDQNYESQFVDLRNWAKSNQFEVVASFGEKVSGYDKDAERFEYDKMKDFVLKNNIQDIAIWEISRLSRSMVRTRNEIDFFTANKVNINFKREGLQSISDNASNTLLLTIIAAMAEMERGMIIDKFARGRYNAVRKGRMIGYSTPPYGYMPNEEGIISVNDEEAKIVRTIFDLINKGQTLYSVAQHLNSLNIDTRKMSNGQTTHIINGKEYKIKWQPITVKRIIERTLYKGIRIYKGETINVPAIVSEEVWNMAQRRFDEKLGYFNRTKYEYLLKGKMKCGKCNHTMGTYSSMKYKPVNYYNCNLLRSVHIKCENGGLIRAQLLDENIFKVLFQHPGSMLTVHQDVYKERDIADKKRQIEYYSTEIVKAGAKNKRIVKMYVDGNFTDDEFQKEKMSVKNEIVDLQNKIDLLNGEINQKEYISIGDILSSYYYSDDFNTKRDFVNKYVNKIIVNNVTRTNVVFEKKMVKDEKILYLEIYAFSNPTPMQLVLTTRSNNILVSSKLSYFNEISFLRIG